MENELIGIDTVLCQSTDVLVVREQDDLGAAGDLGQRLKGGGGPLVVELDQDVVDDQGHRLVILEVGLQACQAAAGS